MSKKFFFSIKWICLLGIFAFVFSCKTNSVLTISYGMVTDVYQNSKAIEVETTEDEETEITIQLREKQILHIIIPALYTEMEKKDVKKADMWIERGLHDHELPLIRLKRIKLVSGKKTKEIYLDAEFGYGNDFISVKGPFFIQQ